MPDPITTKVDAAISEGAELAVRAIVSLQSSLTDFANTHIPALEAAGEQSLASIKSHAANLLAIFEQLLARKTGIK